MKAQQRHQLHTNVLADRVGRFLNEMKSTRKTTSTVVWSLVLVALASLGVWQYAAHATQTQSSALWSELDEATHDPLSGQRELATLADSNPGSFAGRTARFQMARLYFQWSQDAFAPFARTEAIKRVELARKEYEKLQTECADSPLLAQEAMMGVAKADEWLIGVSPDNAEKDLDKAVASYVKLAEKFPKSDLGKTAADRAKTLREHSAEVVKLYRQLNQAVAPTQSLQDILKSAPDKPIPDKPVPDAKPEAKSP
jgi:hypothetical protein